MSPGKKTKNATPPAQRTPPDPVTVEATVPGPIPSISANTTIVGIGASAGGLEAFEQFFRALPAETGMAFVLVSHLDPTHDSLLSEILQRMVNLLTLIRPQRCRILHYDRGPRSLGALENESQFRVADARDNQRGLAHGEPPAGAA